MSEITLAELLKAGVHFGHQIGRWHPKMKSYIFAARNGIYIVDLEKTKAQLESVCHYVEELTAKGGTVLFVGTKRQAKPIIEREAKRAGVPYVTNRWIGGTFTNYSTVSRLISKLKQLRSDRDSGALGKYTKKERLMFEEEIIRLEQLVGGIVDLNKLPEAVFIVDIKQERTAVREAKKTGLTVIAMADTNVNPAGITYPIPANDDATKSIDLIVTAVADAIMAGRQRIAAAAEASLPPTEAAVDPQLEPITE